MQRWKAPIWAAAAWSEQCVRLEVLRAGTDLGMHLAHVCAVAHGQHQLQHALQGCRASRAAASPCRCAPGAGQIRSVRQQAKSRLSSCRALQITATAHGQHQLQHALQDVGHRGQLLGPVGVHLQQARLGVSSCRALRITATADREQRLSHALQDVGHCGQRLGPVGAHPQQARLGVSSSRPNQDCQAAEDCNFLLPLMVSSGFHMHFKLSGTLAVRCESMHAMCRPWRSSEALSSLLATCRLLNRGRLLRCIGLSAFACKAGPYSDPDSSL